LLRQVCASLGCRIGFPAQIEQLALESPELQTLPNHSLVLNSLLRNRSATVQSWPSLELTLLDSADKAIARRLFVPADYLAGSGDLAKGFAARSERSAKIYFELAQLHPANYRVYMFYP